MSPDPTDIFHELGFKAIKKRRFAVFPLSGLKTADEATLKNAQLKIRDLVASNDTTTGVQFTFTKTAKYWAVIKALDICDYEGATSYIPYKNNIWVLNMTPSEYPKNGDIPPK